MTRSQSLAAFVGLLWQENRKQLALGGGLAALTSIMGLALLGISGWFIAATAIAGMTVASAVVFDVFTPSASIRLLALGRTFSRYGERIITHDITFKITASLREKLFLRWAEPDTAQALMQRPARLLFRLTSDVESLEGFYLRQLIPLMALVGSTVLAVVILGFVYWPLALALFGFVSIVSLTIVVLGVRSGAAVARCKVHAEEALRARFIDAVAGHTENLMAGRVEKHHNAVMAAHDAYAHAEIAFARLDRILAAGIGLAGTVLLAGLLASVAVLVEQSALSIPVAALVMLLGLAVLEPLNALRRGASEWGRVRHAASRLMPRLMEKASVKQEALPPEGMALVMSGVMLAQRHTFAQTPLDLAVSKGERLAIIGASGAGKSTLLNLICGELTPTTGTVLSLPSSTMGQHSIVFQGSVRDNLILAQPDANDAALWTALDAVGLQNDLISTGRTLDSRLGEGGLGLSQGQMRRLALAQQLLRNASLLLLDEPTENVDAATAGIMLQALHKLSRENTLVMATHAYREAVLADRIILLEDGSLCGDYHKGDTQFTTILENLRKDC